MPQYFGLDISTQKLKAVLVDCNLNLIYETEVNYDSQLPEFRTQGGVIRSENGTVTTPVILWVKALDLLLDQMQVEGVDFSNIRAISGAAQQHGSVYWQKGSRAILRTLDPSKFLHQQLKNCFSIKESPTWMDSSTTKYCKILEESVGSPEELAKITGSRAYERFTGPQIAKIAETRKVAYENCERITLISNFVCSLFLGDYAQIDFSDASGMNLMNIRTKEWDGNCMKALKAPNLEEKLGKPVPPHTSLGYISSYFVKRFGFNSSCVVSSFAGDNPSSCAGMRLTENDIVISLGTSDTVILPLRKPETFLNGHVLCSTTDKKSFLALLCFKNGSLTRERIKNLYANKSWQEFEKLLDSTPRGNFGNIAVYFDNQEILPFVRPGDFHWDPQGRTVKKFFTSGNEVRALIEGQFLARKAYAEDMGLVCTDDSRIIATGGGSCNTAVLQVLADVFNTPVYTQLSTNSAAIGAAYLSKLAVEPDLNFADLIKELPEPKLVTEPNRDSLQIYGPMLTRLRIMMSNLPG